MENSATRMTRMLGTANMPPELVAAWQGKDQDDQPSKRLPKVKTYIERSFEKRYFVAEYIGSSGKDKENQQGENITGARAKHIGEDRYAGVDLGDRYVYLHPNGLCVLGVAATHGAVQRALAKDIDKDEEAVLSTKFNSNWAVSAFQFEGKKRLNAPMLHEDSKICSLKVNGSAWDIRCGVKGKLLELNSRLLGEPELWSQMPASEGWIAVIQTQSKKDVEKMMGRTKSFEEYVTMRAEALARTLGLSDEPETDEIMQTS